jgi:hypothetical protein
MATRRKYTPLPILLAFLAMTCEKSPTGPEPVKDPRTYTWTIDTLAYPGSFQTEMRDIWGSSPSDVYVVGHNFLNSGLMWHFDGAKWTDVKLSTMQGGTIAGAIDLSAIYGFSANDIWAVGEHLSSNPMPPPNFLDSTLIIHYDGVQWREENLQRGRGLWSISGVPPDDLWACGTDGTLCHHDGSAWKRDSVALAVPPDGSLLLWDIKTKSLSEAYMIGNVTQNALARIITFFFMRNGGVWSLVDSFFVQPGHVEVKFGQNGIWVSPQGTLYSFGPHIFRWIGSSWVKVYDIIDALRRMAGTSDESIFAVGDFGNILHYNGSDWYQFNELKNPNVVYSSVWTDGKEVFVVGYFNDGSKTMILHGR